MPEPARLSAPLSSRRPNGRLRARAGGMAISALAWIVFVAALVLVPVWFVESLPAHAVTEHIIFPLPHSGGGGVPGLKDGHGSGCKAAEPPPIHPPQPLPLALIRPPAEIAPPENNPEAANDAETSDIPNGTGDGLGGPSGSGTGPGNGGPGGPGGPGSDDNPDDTRVSEDHPGLERPRIIPSSRAVPDYPAMARRAHVMGTVELRIVIDEEGRVGRIEVVRAPDSRFGFDLAAIEAVKRWRYEPGRLDGRPVAVEALVLVEFTLAR
jgi:protein TonB